MNKRLVAILLALLIVISLTGCQLAREDAGGETSPDRLIGVFITTEHLDLFDFEGYINDNLNSFSGGEIKLDNSSSEYQGRLYATLTERILTSEETGEKSTIEEYVFDGMSGISYFSAKYFDTEDGESYIGTEADDAISDGNTAHHYGDDEEKTTLEGVIYVSPSFMGKAFYVNPVYQSPDGSVYAMTGNGFACSDVGGEGGAYSSTLDETTTITENGESKAVSTSVKISVVTMYAPEQMVILQMDEDGNVVARDGFAPEDVPEKLITHSDAEYIIIETHKSDREGMPFVTRELFSQSEETASSFYCRDDGVCVKKWIQMIWN